jgi:hypothetical protein
MTDAFLPHRIVSRSKAHLPVEDYVKSPLLRVWCLGQLGPRAHVLVSWTTYDSEEGFAAWRQYRARKT